MNILYAVLAFIVALGPLIIFHELGHYWVARWCKVKVLRFSIGFGRPLLRMIRGKEQTEWILSAIPFGGYVAMLDEREKRSEKIYSEAELQHAFNRQTVWKRSAIVAAGPIANLLLAVVIYWLIGVIGVEEPRAILGQPPAGSLAQLAGLQQGDEIRSMNDEPVLSMPDLRWRLLKVGIDQGTVQLGVTDSLGQSRLVPLNLEQFSGHDLENDFIRTIGLVMMPVPPVIGQVVADGAAGRAGLQPGDRVTAINGQPILTANELQQRISRAANKPLQVELDRAGTRLQIGLVPEEKTDPETGVKAGRIGVRIGAPLPMTKVSYGPIDAAVRALSRTWDTTILSFRLLGKMLTGDLSLKSLSGPVTIADYAGQSAQLGIMVFLSFVAGISISVGIMNLLPIPMLDGGHLLYYAVEILSGRPASERLMEWGQKAGLVALAGLTALALFNDFSRLLS
jgi:regulator of sigma E protease